MKPSQKTSSRVLARMRKRNKTVNAIAPKKAPAKSRAVLPRSGSIITGKLSDDGFLAVADGQIAFAVWGATAAAVRKRALAAINATFEVLEGDTSKSTIVSTTPFVEPSTKLPLRQFFRPIEASIIAAA